MTEDSISLGEILNSLIQSTYHDLSILSELLPRKSDMEKKLEIIKFCKKAKHRFVRLLALANWAASSDKIQDFSQISAILDDQAQKYVDTADRLLYQSQIELKQACLPQFCVITAIDVLTTGNFPFLPTCIAKRFLKPVPLSMDEKTATLYSLDQIIRQRLISIAPYIPPYISKHLTLVPRGCLTMHVPYEFKAKFTVLGDDTSLPWRLIQLDFLVRDPKSCDTRPLVHSNQKLYLHTLVQSRLCPNTYDILQDAYEVLHSFALSLQLQVLHSQLVQLQQQWGEQKLYLDDYVLGETIRIAYWRSNIPVILEQASLTISADPKQPHLMLSHNEAPVAAGDFNENSSSSSFQVPPHVSKDRVIYGDQLLLDRLIHSCIQSKSLHALQTVKKCLLDKKWPYPLKLRRSPPALIIGLSLPDGPDLIEISKDPRNGKLVCLLHEFNSTSLLQDTASPFTASRTDFNHISLQLYLDELARSLYDKMTYAAESLTLFRAHLKLWQLEQQALQMNLKCSCRLPLREDSLPGYIPITKEKDKSRIPTLNRIFIHLNTSNHFLLVHITATTTANSTSRTYIAGAIEEQYCVVQTQATNFTLYEAQTAHKGKTAKPDVTATTSSSSISKSVVQKMSSVNSPVFLQVETCYEIKMDYLPNIVPDIFHLSPLQRRRIQGLGAEFSRPSSLCISTPPNISYLWHLTSNLDSSLPILTLSKCLSLRNCYSHFSISSNVCDNGQTALVLSPPPCPSYVNASVYRRFCQHLKSLRLNFIPNKGWVVQIILKEAHHFPTEVETTSIIIWEYPSHLQGDSILDAFMLNWESVLMLYGPVVELSSYLRSRNNLSKVCSIYQYAYKSIRLCYYANTVKHTSHVFTIDITWDPEQKKFNLEFLDNSILNNAKSGLEYILNQSYCIPQLVTGLVILLPVYQLLDMTVIVPRLKVDNNNPKLIQFNLKNIPIEIEVFNKGDITIKLSNDRLYKLLQKLISYLTTKESEQANEEIVIPPLQVPAIQRALSEFSAFSPAPNMRPFSPANRNLNSVVTTPYTVTRSGSFFSSTVNPNSSFPARSPMFFPQNSLDAAPSNMSQILPPTTTIPLTMFRLLMAPVMHKSSSYVHSQGPFLSLLAAFNLLEQEYKISSAPRFDNKDCGESSATYKDFTMKLYLDDTFSDLGVKLRFKDIYTSDPQKALTDMDLSALESLFHLDKIKAPHFSSNSLTAYMILLGAPIDILQSIVKILAFNKNTPSHWLWKPEICITVPENSTLDKAYNVNPGLSSVWYLLPKSQYLLYVRFNPLMGSSTNSNGARNPLDLFLVVDDAQSSVELQTIDRSSQPVSKCEKKIMEVLYKISHNASFHPLLDAIEKICQLNLNDCFMNEVN